MSNPVIEWIHFLPDGEEEIIKFPAKMIVCYTCDGTGSTVNPSIDGNGITADEMDEMGDDFREDYFGGVYDVQCRTCKGLRVIAQLDRPACNRNPKLRALLKQKEAVDAEIDRDDASEAWLRRAESGERW